MAPVFVGRSKHAKFYVEVDEQNVQYCGEWQQCWTDVHLWEVLRSGEWRERRPWAHRGKGDRWDLLCNVGGWPRDTMFIRVVGWAFFARRKMSFEEFQRKLPVKNSCAEFAHQVNHLGGPENCCLDHLEFGTVAENRQSYELDAGTRHRTVWKRPAAARKRPASAL